MCCQFRLDLRPKTYSSSKKFVTNFQTSLAVGKSLLRLPLLKGLRKKPAHILTEPIESCGPFQGKYLVLICLQCILRPFTLDLMDMAMWVIFKLMKSILDIFNGKFSGILYTRKPFLAVKKLETHLVHFLRTSSLSMIWMTEYETHSLVMHAQCWVVIRNFGAMS